MFLPCFPVQDQCDLDLGHVSLGQGDVKRLGYDEQHTEI